MMIDKSAIIDRVLPLNLIANTAIFYIAARIHLPPLGRHPDDHPELSELGL